MQSCKSARASGVAGLILLVFAMALYGHTIDVYVEPEACSVERVLASARQNPLFVQNTFFASARAHPLNWTRLCQDDLIYYKTLVNI